MVTFDCKCRKHAVCAACLDSARQARENPLAPAKGIAWGVVLSATLWCIIIPLVIFFAVHA